MNITKFKKSSCFNPCFNGQQSKNFTHFIYEECPMSVSILVLMDSRVKTMRMLITNGALLGFNPCFNGQQSKNCIETNTLTVFNESFNPCFNGQQSKNISHTVHSIYSSPVSILVLMDSRVKTVEMMLSEAMKKQFQSLF